MANMGLSDLVVVNPGNLNMDEARKMAVHADDILASRTEVDTLAEAVSDCGVVIGTTARKGLYRQHAKAPRDWAQKALQVSETGKAAVVFGKEDNGLNNDDLALCTQIIQIPTSTKYSSLNLSQAVLICCYEIFVASGTYEAPNEKTPEAPSELRERMFDMWRETLLEIGFMEEDKADHMMLGLRRILSRGSLTVDDIKILMGVARQSVWAAQKRRL